MKDNKIIQSAIFIFISIFILGFSFSEFQTKTGIDHQIAYKSYVVKGLYTGMVKRGVPQGYGKFVSYKFTLEGEWEDGMPTIVDNFAIGGHTKVKGTWADDDINIYDYILKKEKIVEDLIELKRKISSDYYKKKVYIKELDKSWIENNIDDMQIIDFYKLVHEITAKLKDNNVTANYQVNGKGLPLTFTFIEKRAFVDVSNEELGISKGDEIISVNNKPLYEMFENNIDVFFGRDESDKIPRFERYAFTDIHLMLQGISCIKDTIEVVIKNKEGLEHTYEMKSDFTGPEYVKHKYEYKEDIIQHFYEEFCVIDINRLGEKNNLEIYDKFFKKASEEKINTVFIDLTDNIGGTISVNYNLMRYIPVEEIQTVTRFRSEKRSDDDDIVELIKKGNSNMVDNLVSENAYYGNVVVLVSENTSSAALSLAAVLDYNYNVLVVGSGVSQNFISSANLITTELKNSGIKVEIPSVGIIQPNSHSNVGKLQMEYSFNTKKLLCTDDVDAVYNEVYRMINN